jgi:hypothetical protein
MRRVGPVLFLLLLAGCVPEPAFDNDPLLGGRPVARAGAVAPAPKTSWTTTAPSPAAPASTPANPASLAAAAPPADASTLRLGATPATLASNPHDDGDPWRIGSTPTGAKLKQPETITDPSVRPSAVLAPPTAGAPATPAQAAGPDQFAQLQDQLTQRGVLFQSLDGPDDHGVWRFSCGVPSRSDPSSIHRIEVSAPGDRGLAAMRAAIQQIDRDVP